MNNFKIFLALVLVSSVAKGQDKNLVPNWSFEELTKDCVSYESNDGQGGAQPTFEDVMAYWNIPTPTDWVTRLPIVYNTCDKTGDLGLPKNQTGWQRSHSGDGYISMTTYTWLYARKMSGTLGDPKNPLAPCQENPPGTDIDYRNYIQVELINPLEAGKVYEVSFYASLAEEGGFATRLGVYFSNEEIDIKNNCDALHRTGKGDFSAHIESDTIITDMINWTEIKGCYTATGGESHLILGNLDTTGSYDSLFVDHMAAAQYYIDDVTVINRVDHVLFPDTQYICDDIVLNANTFQDTTIRFEWQDGSEEGIYTVSDSGLYWVKRSTYCNSRTDSTIIIPIPELEPTSEKIGFCFGDTITLSTKTLPKANYRWSTGELTPSITMTFPDTVYLTSTSCGETQQDTFEIIYTSLDDFDLGKDTLICDGTTIKIGDSLTGLVTYLWQDGSTEPYYEVTEAGLYTLDINVGCDSQQYERRIVSASALPPINSVDSFICEGQSITLSVPSQGNWDATLWPDGSAGDQFVITEPGTYEVRTTNSCDTLEETLTFSDCNCDLFFVPNSFSPNGDGVNDVLHTRIDCIVENYELSIYDRLGGFIYTTADPDKGWDGTKNGKAVNDGVFVYRLSATVLPEFGGNTITQMGNITLIR